MEKTPIVSSNSAIRTDEDKTVLSLIFKCFAPLPCAKLLFLGKDFSKIKKNQKKKKKKLEWIRFM